MKKKKNAREKRVLIGAVAVAGVMIAGSTFAWFTSKDEVTNRLTASADYGVSIVEDFAPPSNWLPGQDVNKDAAAVNTGNVSAFVKMTLQGDFNIETEIAAGEALPSGADQITDGKLRGHKLVELRTGVAYDERVLLQAGGHLSHAPENVVTGNIDSKNFTPKVTGMYLFRREVKNGTTTTYDYSGYYFKADSNKYYALKTIATTAADGTNVNTTDVLQDKGAVLTDADISSVQLRAFENLTIPSNSEKLKWDYSKVTDAANPQITVTYMPNGTSTPTPKSDIKVIIKLANIAGDTPATNQWQYIDSEKAFYYTNDLEPSATSNRLVDSVMLDAAVQDSAFSVMDFDLTVKLDSVQVVKDAQEKELANSADQLGIQPDGDITYDNNEISVVKWKKAATS